MAKGRRANGEGTVGKLPDGRWAASRQIILPDGRQVRVKREGKTRALAVARLQEAAAKLLSGTSAGRAPTVREHLERWFDDTYCAGGPRPSSKRTTRSLLDNQILPYLGDVRLDKLRTPRLRTWLADLGRDDYSPKTIAEARKILRAALDQAVEDLLIAFNPVTRKLRGPKVAASAGTALTVEQARGLLAAARGERLELAIRLALGLGLRRGEVCGLRWQDVNLESGWLFVGGQLTYCPGEGLTWVDTTKSAAGLRTLRLPAVLVGALRWHQTRQRAERLVMEWPENGYVFTSPQDGGPLRPTSLYRTFKDIATGVGLPALRFHDLRHSAASFLLAEGVPVKSVAAILGHARTSTTLDTYGHLLPGAADDAPDRVARLLDDGADDQDADGAAGVVA